MKKKGFPVFRLLGFLALAAVGAGVAILASREEGREQLARFGELAGQKAGEYIQVVNSGVKQAGEWAEQAKNQNQGIVKFPAYSPTHNGVRQNDLTAAM